MKQTLYTLTLATMLLGNALWADTTPEKITIEGIALNPEGIEYNPHNDTLFLSSLNALPIIKIQSDATYQTFAKGEKFPLSTAGLQIDAKHNRLLAAAFNGAELMDNNPQTKGVSFLRVYDLQTGVLQQEVKLSTLAPDATSYFANDVAVDAQGNAYVTDWYANLIYKVTPKGEATLFWQNHLGLEGGPNGIDLHPDGYLLVSIIKVNPQGIYEKSALLKIALHNPHEVHRVAIDDQRFAGFDGMVIDPKGNLIGISNDQKSGGGNLLLKLTSKDNWQTASITNAKDITPATTLALDKEQNPFVIQQDFSEPMKKRWTIQKILF